MFKPNSYRKKDKKVIYGFDTEDNNGEIIQAQFYNGKDYKSFHIKNYKSTFELKAAIYHWLFSISDNRSVYIGTIGLEYDIINLSFPEFLKPDVWEIQAIKSRWIYCKLVNTNIIFFDLLNHAKLSAKKWGELLKCKKLKYNPNSIRYCQRDAKIAYKAALFLHELYNLENGTLKLTAPSAALDIFKNSFLKRCFREITPSEREFFKSAYYGGRVEIFKHGKTKANLVYVDAVSMYPYVMQLKLPDYDSAYITNSLPLRIANDEYVADVTVHVPEDTQIPVLPFRLNDKLIFPVGKFRGTFCKPELELSIKHGARVLHTHKVIAFHNAEPFLKDYTLHFFEKKNNAATKAIELFYKVGLLNSLYGKFGTSGSLDELGCIDNDETLGYCFNKIDDRKMPAYANVIWSAYITSYARVHLHNHLMQVEHLVYCDTDSIVYFGKCNFNHGDKLGDFKLKGKYVFGNFILPKLYYLTEKVGNKYIRCKGVPIAFSEKFIKDLYIEFLKPIRFKEGMRRGLKPNTWTMHKRTLDSIYDKRVVLKGGYTKPLTLKDGDLDGN